jgi:hypothetical protein
MFPSDEVNESKMSTDQVDSTIRTNPAVSRIAATLATTARDTKDSGRVHIGGGMMRFDTRDSGRVHVGGGMMRF